MNTEQYISVLQAAGKSCGFLHYPDITKHIAKKAFEVAVHSSGTTQTSNLLKS